MQCATIRLGDAEYPRVMCASGALGFFGEGYPSHRLLEWFGLDTADIGLVTKTAVLDPRLGPGKGGGNMPLKDDGITPVEFLPKSVFVSPRSWFQRAAGNAVGLSCPGIRRLLAMNRWQQIERPFGLSIMAVRETTLQRHDELREIVDILGPELPHFRAPFFIELNVSCPNTGHDVRALCRDGLISLDALARLGRPVMVKYNVLAPDETILRVTEHPVCEGVTMGNTFPINMLTPDETKRYFGTPTSPLARYGGGGLSGLPLHDRTLRKVASLLDAGLSKEVFFCGGVMRPSQVPRLIQNLRVSGIQIGSGFFLEPWNVHRTVRRANTEFLAHRAHGGW